MSVEKAVEAYESKIGDIVADYKFKKAVLSAEFRGHLEPAIIELFHRHNCDLTLEINAYVPYFNDGDECRYRMYVIEEVEGDDGEWISLWKMQIYKDVGSLFASIEDITEDVFGSHTRFYVSKAGLTVEQYTDHD